MLFFDGTRETRSFFWANYILFPIIGRVISVGVRNTDTQPVWNGKTGKGKKSKTGTSVKPGKKGNKREMSTKGTIRTNVCVSPVVSQNRLKVLIPFSRNF